MRRRLLVPELGRFDLPGAVAVALLAAAAVLPGARDILLAAATVSAVAWLGGDALRTDRRGPRAKLVMAVALALLAALPAVLLAIDHGLWAGARKPSLDAGLALWSVGIVSVALGSRVARAIPLPGKLERFAGGAGVETMTSSEPRGRRANIAVAAVVLLSLIAFVIKVGGPSAYLSNLNNSGAATYGLTYFIWGMSFAKFAAFVAMGEDWRQGRRPSPGLIVLSAAALALLLFIGSRLLLLVALIQLLLLYAALAPHRRGFRVAVAATAIVGVIAFVAIGEFRRWENLTHRASFPTYLVDTGLPQLPVTYVNDYADAVRLSVLVRQVVPGRAGYEYGKELLRMLLHPIPSSLRPTISQAPALAGAFTSGNKNGNALPIPVEGYIEFGFPGAIAFSLLLGLFVGLVDRFGATARDVGVLAAATAAGTGAVIVMRGSLTQGVALAAIDVLGFFVVHRILYRGAAARVPAVAAPNDYAEGGQARDPAIATGS